MGPSLVRRGGHHLLIGSDGTDHAHWPRYPSVVRPSRALRHDDDAGYSTQARTVDRYAHQNHQFDDTRSTYRGVVRELFFLSLALTLVSGNA